MARAALRYARALADAAGQDCSDTYRQLEDFRSLLNSSTDLKEVLLNPTIAVARRVRVLHAIALRTGMGVTARNFIAVLVQHERLNQLREILDQVQLVIDRRQGISEAEVTTARPLQEQERTGLERHVAGLAGTRVRANFGHDGSLLGGVVIRIGSTIYDGSVKGRLERMRERLTGD